VGRSVLGVREQRPAPDGAPGGGRGPDSGLASGPQEPTCPVAAHGQSPPHLRGTVRAAAAPAGARLAWSAPRRAAGRAYRAGAGGRRGHRHQPGLLPARQQGRGLRARPGHAHPPGRQAARRAGAGAAVRRRCRCCRLPTAASTWWCARWCCVPWPTRPPRWQRSTACCGPVAGWCSWNTSAQGRLARWQDRLTPLWVWFGAGCHPNRDSQAAIAAAGFVIGPLEGFESQPNSAITRPFLQGTATRPMSGRTD